jgi:hypothetical protein
VAFIRKRISPSRRQTPSYQVIETYREDGKVKQRVLANLGCNPTPEKALLEFRKEHKFTLGVIEELKMKSSKPSGHDRKLERWSRTCAKQRDTIDKLEALICSGTKLSSRERRPFDSTSFLDWVIDRNSSGWF